MPALCNTAAGTIALPDVFAADESEVQQDEEQEEGEEEEEGGEVQEHEGI
eukprot:gene19551-43795_t